MVASPDSEDRLPHLVESLISGFEELRSIVRIQFDSEKALREKIEFAANEYEHLLAAGSSSSAASVSPSRIVKQIRPPLTITRHPETSSQILKAQRAIQSYRALSMEMAKTNGAKCPVAHHTGEPENLERDFTTPGVQGTLGCPFAKMSNGLTQGLDVEEDPIAAEFHQDKISVRSPNDQRPGHCPIRFLDQHSPEEVAKYFENHKHEIPRSHEICVRRYQQNDASARQLDAKYGSLVNMIQGLGVKHKAYLPERDRIEERDKSAIHGVEKWAENVSSEAAPAVQDIPTSDEQPRVSRFERPLREVRVGESPSRPWGISVPADKEVPPSALQSEDGVGHLQIKSENSRASPDTKPARCPVDHGQASRPRLQKTPIHDEPVSPNSTESRTQIIFNGPVFFGYSADQVADLLQKTNLGATMTGASPAR
ncbi:hypothetical protein PV05_11990 [Exophiala xenobiotica]|uniref:Uncharacterized protein n=1 Tax=Exophiala xenobiotica TaxID=348802 RepID=A0A0D2E6M3_9EURO|nr:uncharacterized protein PV05_11990 [Exophiala xenobiotica]KIW50400.1 hypothetical protein PV05_11990 [Exophiala xenobiotica]